MKTVRDFYEYEKMAFGCSTDGALPSGQHKMYRVVRGKLTRIAVQDMSSLKLNPNYILIFGTYGDDPQTEEDLSTLRVNGFIKSIYKSSDFMVSMAKAEATKAASEKTAKPVQKKDNPSEPATTDLEKTEVIVRSASVVADATAYEVVDLRTYERASDIIRAIKQMAKEVGATFDPMIEKAHQAHKEALAQKAKFVRPLEDAEKTLKGKMAEWYRAEQARAEAERKAAEEAAALKRAALEAAKKQSYEDALKAGDLQAAREISTIDVVAEVKVVEPVQTKVSGISTRKVYKAEVIDLEALVKAASETPQFLAFLMPNESALNAFARAAKTTNCAIPGVRFVEEVVVGVRA